MLSDPTACCECGGYSFGSGSGKMSKKGGVGNEHQKNDAPIVKQRQPHRQQSYESFWVGSAMVHLVLDLPQQASTY